MEPRPPSLPPTDAVTTASVLIANHGEKAADEAAAYLLMQIILDNHEAILSWQAVLDAVVKTQGLI